MQAYICMCLYMYESLTGQRDLQQVKVHGTNPDTLSTTSWTLTAGENLPTHLTNVLRHGKIYKVAIFQVGIYIYREMIS